MKGPKARFKKYGAKPKKRRLRSQQRRFKPQQEHLAPQKICLRTQQRSQNPSSNTTTQGQVHLKNKGAEGPFQEIRCKAPTARLRTQQQDFQPNSETKTQNTSQDPNRNTFNVKTFFEKAKVCSVKIRIMIFSVQQRLFF